MKCTIVDSKEETSVVYSSLAQSIQPIIRDRWRYYEGIIVLMTSPGKGVILKDIGTGSVDFVDGTGTTMNNLIERDFKPFTGKLVMEN